MGESARDEAQWFPNAFSFWELHLCGSCECLKLWLERQTSTKLGPQETMRKVMKRKCLWWPHIVHLNLICMSYNQKKGRKSNWEFDSQPRIPWKQRSNEVRLGHALHCWKDFLRAIRYFFHIFKTNMIWKRYEPPKFWDNKSPNFWDYGVQGKIDIWM